MHCSRVFWYAVLESMGIVGMAMYVALHSSSHPLTRAATACKSTSSRRSSQRPDASTKYDIVAYLSVTYPLSSTRFPRFLRVSVSVLSELRSGWVVLAF